MFYRGYKIEVHPIAYNDGDYGSMFDSLDALLEKEEIDNWEYVYVIYDADDAALNTPSCVDEPDKFEPWYDTVDDAVEAIDAAWDGPDMEYVEPYELELSSGEYACMLAEYEPSVEEAEEFVSSILGEGERVVSVTLIDWDSAVDNYDIDVDELAVLRCDEATDDYFDDEETEDCFDNDDCDYCDCDCNSCDCAEHCEGCDCSPLSDSCDGNCEVCINLECNRCGDHEVHDP